MYDTEKRIELVKKRMHEYHRRQERRTVCRLSVLCTLLFLSLVGTMGMMQSQPIDITGMYGTILLHEDAGGYVLVAVISFTVAVRKLQKQLSQFLHISMMLSVRQLRMLVRLQALM